MAVLRGFWVAVALSTITAFGSIANEHHSPSSFYHRRQSNPTVLPSNWTFKGCFTDNVAARSLDGPNFASDTMTVESCINFCSSSQFVLAGLEFASQCFCGNEVVNGGTLAAATDCNQACNGNAKELCGAGSRLSVFSSGLKPPPPPVITPVIGQWVSLGCYSDNVNGNGRSLTTQMNVANLTNKACTDACFAAGFPLAGTEFSDECYCGSSFSNGGAPAAAGDCNMLCAGNSSEFCGGPNRLNAYNFTGTDLPATTGGGGGGGGGAAANVFPVKSGLPGNFSYAGCWVDNAFGRVFTLQLPGNPENTVEACIEGCIAQNMNFTLAGTEFSDECYCGTTLVEAATLSTDSTCNMGCAGNATEACGGPNRLSVYSSTGTVPVLPVPSIQKTNLPGSWVYSGCLREPDGHRVFDNQIIWIGNNSAIACMNQCAAFGYTASGTEFGQECYCGDIGDVALNGGVIGADSECTTPCPGDPIHICGDGNRLTYYSWNATLNVWHQPAITGHYEFFVGGLVVPLIATVGINNKVTFLEKGGTGIPNATGAYELDTTLVNNFSLTWREMHIKTDVFCSGSIILPDKAGRQINVGGWSEDSTFGVRLYTPDGSAGVNGTNDWEENGDILKLQRMRWYPTAAMLPNGSILVMGGETGSNASPQPNLEILPKPVGGDTVVDLDFLLRTDPNNLYPFIIVLPSGRLFVGYYNEARILDAKTFETLVELPNIPGNVNNFLAGRTYPLEGAAMPFPQHAPYTDPLRILICGGSTNGAGQAIDNCVSIEPEAPNATWTLERMPSRRVMPCMVALPDGTIMIMNGGQQGVAGFGLASEPNLVALLYDPTQPVNQRISVLNSTIVARLYHSEAALLPDGRVLVSGSDPQTADQNGTVIFPEEFRIEVYVPPYLSQGFKQPTFNISVTDWAYGQTVTITNIHLFQGPISKTRVSLVAAVSSTHGNTMGGRTIFPAATCSGTSCTVTAPPNSGVSPPGWHQLFILDGPTPSHSQWVRIGGDPSKLGNWPDLPGFTMPGI